MLFTIIVSRSFFLFWKQKFKFEERWIFGIKLDITRPKGNLTRFSPWSWQFNGFLGRINILRKDLFYYRTSLLYQFQALIDWRTTKGQKWVSCLVPAVVPNGCFHYRSEDPRWRTWLRSLGCLYFREGGNFTDLLFYEKQWSWLRIA